MLKPVARQSLSDAVFVQLRDEIVSGRISGHNVLHRSPHMSRPEKR